MNDYSAAKSQPLLINGAFEHRDDEIEIRNPYGGELITRVAGANEDDVNAAVELATGRIGAHAPVARAEILERAARLVAEDHERFARTIALEAGKPITQARGETDRCIDTLTFSAVEARSLGGEVVPMDSSHSGQGKLAVISRAPAGVVGAISPFNFPLNLVAHKLAPAIAAGCPVVLKPAGQTPLSALLLARVLMEAGLEAGDLSVLPGPGGTVGAAIVAHPDVPVITFTGSSEVGWAIPADEPRKHVALELGNSTPVIVHDDADIGLAAERIAASGFTHAGQSCISVQRVYVHASREQEFTDTLLEHVAGLTAGDPLEEATDLGPMIDSGARERLDEWIDEAESVGARVLETGTEGEILCPTVLAGVPADAKLIHDEAFGPVVSVQSYSDIADAIARSNGTPYGLQAGIFTSRVDHGLDWARRLEFAGVTINETPTFRADQQPYGGLKDSGNTREGPKYAIETMTERRLVIVGGLDHAD